MAALTNNQKLILTLTLLTTTATTLYFTEPANAGNHLAVQGDIKIYSRNGTELTTINLQPFAPGQQGTRQENLIIHNTGKTPVHVSWAITQSQINWSQKKEPKTAGYSHTEDGNEKYTLRIARESGKKDKCLEPERASLLLTAQESVELLLELSYSGKSATAETFTLTITFTASNSNHN